MCCQGRYQVDSRAWMCFCPLGYLIVSVILHEIRGGTFSLREFYLRRIQRLMPNAVFMVLVTVLRSYFRGASLGDRESRGAWSLVVAQSVEYLYLAKCGLYWGDSATSVPLLHTWSLAIEEQFYVLFPVTLWLLSRRPAPLVDDEFTGIGELCGRTLSNTHPSNRRVLFTPDPSLELLAVNMLGAYQAPASVELSLRTFNTHRATKYVGWAGLAIVVAGFFFINEGSNFPGVVALVPTIGTLAVLVSIADGGPGPAGLLSQTPMVLSGKLSYSIYLWHWPLIVLGKSYANLIGRSPQAGALIGLLVGLVFAGLAYQFIEQPLRRRAPGRRPAALDDRRWIRDLCGGMCGRVDGSSSRRP